MKVAAMVSPFEEPTQHAMSRWRAARRLRCAAFATAAAEESHLVEHGLRSTMRPTAPGSTSTIIGAPFGFGLTWDEIGALKADNVIL
jgi:hypothetical protein